MKMGDIIRDLRIKSGMTQEELGAVLGVQKSAIRKYESGLVENIPRSSIQKMAVLFNVKPSYLMGWEDEKTPEIKSNAIFLNNKKIHLIPLFESVSAGFGATAVDYITDYVPLYVSDEGEAAETLCLKVSGNSMYPMIEDGDIIQVHKQTSVDSGSIAVVLLDGEDGLVKKVVYGSTWIELHSINPMYPVQRFDGQDVQRLQVVGLVRKIIKEV